MKQATLVILLAVLAVGCAPARQAVHSDNAAGVSVRLPMVESPGVSVHAEEQGPPEGPLSHPQSVADEYRGRWLTLIEITVTPPAAEAEKSPAPGPEESP